MPADKQYLPSCYARARTTQFGEVINISFNAEALINFIKANTNAKGELKITVSPRRNKDKGLTHNVYLDTWQPDPAHASGQFDHVRRAVENMPPQQPDDVPF